MISLISTVVSLDIVKGGRVRPIGLSKIVRVENALRTVIVLVILDWSVKRLPTHRGQRVGIYTKSLVEFFDLPIAILALSQPGRLIPFYSQV